MLIVFRFLRIIPDIKVITVKISTLGGSTNLSVYSIISVMSLRVDHGFGGQYTVGSSQEPACLCRDTRGECNKDLQDAFCDRGNCFQICFLQDLFILLFHVIKEISSILFVISFRCVICVRFLQVVYYMYAVVGIWLFEGVIKPTPQNR